MYRVIAVLALVAVLIAGLTSCSNDQDSPAAVSTPTTAPAGSSSSDGAHPSGPSHEDLQVAVTSYSNAFLSGDPQAYALLTKRCRDRVAAEQFQLIVDQSKIIYESALTIKSFVAETAGNFARVTYTYELASLNQTSWPWANEDGDWKQDDCP